MARKTINPTLKAKIALEAIQGHRTTAEISSQYGVHPNFITRVKKEAIQNMASVFNQGDNTRVKELEKEQEELLMIIGKKERDNEWLKKKCKQLGLL